MYTKDNIDGIELKYKGAGTLYTLKKLDDENIVLYWNNYEGLANYKIEEALMYLNEEKVWIPINKEPHYQIFN